MIVKSEKYTKFTITTLTLLITMHNYHFYVTLYEKDVPRMDDDIGPQRHHFINVHDKHAFVFSIILSGDNYLYSYFNIDISRVSFHFEVRINSYAKSTINVRNKRNFQSERLSADIKTFNIKNIPISNVNKLLKHHNLWK